MEAELRKLQGQLKVQGHEIEFLRSRQEHLRALADAAIKERDEMKAQLLAVVKDGSGQDLRARNTALELEVANLRRELAGAHGANGQPSPKALPGPRDVSPAPGPRGVVAAAAQPKPTPDVPLLGMGRRLDSRRNSGLSFTSWASTASSRSCSSRSSSVDNRALKQIDVGRLVQEKHRTEELIKQAETARDSTPTKQRARLDGLLAKLRTLDEGLDEKISRSRDSSREPSRSSTPTSISSHDITMERQRLTALQEQMRATSLSLSILTLTLTLCRIPLTLSCCVFLSSLQLASSVWEPQHALLRTLLPNSNEMATSTSVHSFMLSGMCSNKWSVLWSQQISFSANMLSTPSWTSQISGGSQSRVTIISTT